MRADEAPVRRRRLAPAVLALAVHALLPPASARAQAPSAQAPSAEVPPAARQVYDGVMSPFCPGLLLANCPSPQADSLRRAVAARAAAGASRDQLVAELLAAYGDGVRAAPARRGFGLVAWATPLVLLAAAAGWLTRWLPRAAGRARRAPPAPAPGAAPAAPADPRDGTAAELAALDALLRSG